MEREETATLDVICELLDAEPRYCVILKLNERKIN
jgi:hypothetical protein